MNDQKIDCQRAEAPGEKGFAGGGTERGRRGQSVVGGLWGGEESGSGDGLPAPL